MELLNYLISVVVVGIAVQFGELWMVLGIATVMIVASKDIKASIMIVITLAVLYFVNGVGMQEYWMFAMLGLIAMGYLIGLDSGGQAAADPYAGLLGGDMGGMGM